jgi:hypothetical protein
MDFREFSKIPRLKRGMVITEKLDYSKLAASGDYSIAAAVGLDSKAKTGKNGTIVLTRWVESEKRYRVSVGYEGENIKADIWYGLDTSGDFVECQL